MARKELIAAVAYLRTSSAARMAASRRSTRGDIIGFSLLIGEVRISFRAEGDTR